MITVIAVDNNDKSGNNNNNNNDDDDDDDDDKSDNNNNDDNNNNNNNNNNYKGGDSDVEISQNEDDATGAKGTVTKYNSCQIVYLQSTAGIVKNDRYYKIRQVL